MNPLISFAHEHLELQTVSVTTHPGDEVLAQGLLTQSVLRIPCTLRVPSIYEYRVSTVSVVGIVILVWSRYLTFWYLDPEAQEWLWPGTVTPTPGVLEGRPLSMRPVNADPRGSKYPAFKVARPRNHIFNGIWDQSPQILGT